jgi:chromosome segregation ATPase
MVEPTLREILDAVNKVSSKLTLIESQVMDLRSDRDDHEKRIRSVEQRTDEGRRIDALETRITQHDAAFTKLGERIGSLEAGVFNVEKSVEKLQTPKTAPVTYAAVILSAVSIMVVVIFGIVNL